MTRSPCLLISSNEVVQRVAVLPNLLRTDTDLLQLHDLLADTKIYPLRTVIHHFHFVANSKTRGRDGHGISLCGKFQLVVSIIIDVGKAQNIAHTLQSHGYVSVHDLALCVEHDALNDGLLCVGRQCHEDKDNCDDVSVHYIIWYYS